MTDAECRSRLSFERIEIRRLLFFAICVLSSPGSVGFVCADRLRFREVPGDRGEYTANADCLLLVGGKKYAYGDCVVSTGLAEHEISLYFGAQPDEKGPKTNAVIASSRGKIVGRWSGPNGGYGRPNIALGALVRDGDCWENKKTKICVHGRARTSMGRCFLSVKGHTYIDGICPIETYTPLGNFYINDTCHAISKYFGQVAMDTSSTGRASWNGDPPAALAATDLGEVKRQGACWTSETAKICAYAGAAVTTSDCKLDPSQLPDGHD